MTPDILQSWCNTCGRSTEHDLLHKNTRIENIEASISRHITSHSIMCRGCKTGSIYEKWRNSDWPPEDSKDLYKPPRTWASPPSWLMHLEKLYPDIYELLIEVYSAANDAQTRLLSIGVRTALDRVMVHIIGDVGDFDEKLKEMVAQKHITERQAEILSIVIDAGSASAHRAYKPPKELLENMLNVMESIVRDYFVTGPMLATARKLIPPRPKRPKKMPTPSVEPRS